MTTAADVIDVTRYAREYERLRSLVNGVSPEHEFATPPARAIGLALLLRDGVPAWIRTVRQVLSQAAASGTGNAGAAPSHVPRAPPPLTAGVEGSGVSISSSPIVEPARQRDITTLLASLVLSARRTPDPAPIKESSPCQ
jgi:hypothetical protein